MLISREREAKEQLVACGKRLLSEQLVQGTWGNLSVRLDEDYMVCTPSGLDYEEVTADDMVVVEILSQRYVSGNKPTSEMGLHTAIYLARPEVGAVIHTHAKYCSIFAAAEMPLVVEDREIASSIGDEIRIADYGLAGTKKLTQNTVSALGDSCGCLMSHHGMIACGKDLADAFEICCKIEEAAEKHVSARVRR